MAVMDETMRKQSFAFFDLEASGLGTAAKITELSVVAITMNHFLAEDRDATQDLVTENENGLVPRMTSKLTIQINPGVAIHPAASAASGIFNDLVCYRSRFTADTADLVVKTLQHCGPPPWYFVAHNGDRFDFPVFMRHLNKIDTGSASGREAVDQLTSNVKCVDTLPFFRQWKDKLHLDLTLSELNEDTNTDEQRSELVTPPESQGFSTATDAASNAMEATSTVKTEPASWNEANGSIKREVEVKQELDSDEEYLASVVVPGHLETNDRKCTEEEMEHFLAYELHVPGHLELTPHLPSAKRIKAEPPETPSKADSGSRSWATPGAAERSPPANCTGMPGTSSSEPRSKRKLFPEVDCSQTAKQYLVAASQTSAQPAQAVKSRFSKKSNTLANLFRQFHPDLAGNPLLRSHQAEADCIQLMLCCRALKYEFLEYSRDTAKPLSDFA